MSAEADVFFSGRGEIEGIRNECRVFQAWSTRKDKRPSFRVKCTRKEEYPKDKDKQGEWQTKVGLLIPEIERTPTGVIAAVVQIHPRTNREQRAALFCRLWSEELDVSVSR